MIISIHDFRSVDRAEIELGLLTLVAGRNASGKSSICMAAAATLTQDAMACGLAKKDAYQLIRSGATVAAASLKSDDGAVDISWPAATVTLRGTPPRISRNAAGIDRFTAMRTDDRARLIETSLGAAPTRDDLAAAIGKVTDALWQKVEADGWDVCHDAAKRRGAEMKGAWREVTGEQYGASKAEAWKVEETAPAEEDLIKARLARTKAIEAEAASKFAKDGESRLAELTADREKLVAAVTSATDDLDAALHARQSVAAIDGSSGAPCPWCGKGVRRVSGSLTLQYERVDLVHDPKENEKRQVEINALDKALTEAKQTSSDAAAALAKADAAIAELTRQRDQASAQTPAAMSIQDADAAVAAAEAALDRAKRSHRARELADKIAMNATIVAALAPSGVRKTKMVDAIERMNLAMAAFAGAGNDVATTVNVDLEVSRGGRPYVLLSKSEQFRADVAIQVALARAAEDAIVIIDGADILDAAGRNAMFAGLLSDAGIPALVAMTMNAERLMPDLTSVGGNSYWIGK